MMSMLRSGIRVLQHGAIFALLACQADPGGPARPAAAGSRSAVPARAPIAIREATTICVRVTVDQSVWPSPVNDETTRNLSGVLTSELGRVHEQRGGSRWHGANGREPRFFANWRGNHPTCGDSPDDISIEASYTPRADGMPFQFSYRLRQGDSLEEHRFERDIFGDMRSGVLRITILEEPLSSALHRDLHERARLILDDIST